MAETLTNLTISASELDDPEFVTAELGRIYRELGKQPDEKATALTGLVSAIKIRDGSVLGDEILDVLTTPDDESEGATTRRTVLNALQGVVAHPEVPVTTLEIVFDEDTLEVRDIMRKTVLPDEDEQSIKGKRNMQRRVPSGPKQNDVSGGLRRVDPKSRH